MLSTIFLYNNFKIDIISYYIIKKALINQYQWKANQSSTELIDAFLNLYIMFKILDI